MQADHLGYRPLPRHQPNRVHRLSPQVDRLPLLLLLRQALHHAHQVHAAGLHELPEEVDHGLEHRQRPSGFHRRDAQHCPDVHPVLQQQ